MQRPSRMNEKFELIATIFVVPKHVETCETRTEQNVFARLDEFGRTADGLRKIRTD